MSGTAAEILPIESIAARHARERVVDLSTADLREWIALDASYEELDRLGAEGAHFCQFLWPRLESVASRVGLDDEPRPLTERARIALQEWPLILWCLRARSMTIPRRYFLAHEGENSPACRAVERWIAQGRRKPTILTLLGNSGCGKTHGAVNGMKALYDRSGRRIDMAFVHVPALCRELMNPDLREAAFERASETRFAVLDDLGATHIKHDSFLEAMIEDLIVTREAERRPTIITANWTAAQLENALGYRISDRLLGGLVEELPGRSFRRHAGRRG